jgi:hypothetical protein
LRFDDAASETTFLDYLDAVETLPQRCAALEAALAELASVSPFATTIARLRCFRGIDTLSAAGICAEVGDFHRFAHPRLLSGYLGLVPCERTSDQQRRQGSITKAGPPHARRLLVEAAHHYRHQPRLGERLIRRQAGQDGRVCAISWRAQRRLHSRSRALALTRGEPGRDCRGRLRARARHLPLGGCRARLGRHPATRPRRRRRGAASYATPAPVAPDAVALPALGSRRRRSRPRKDCDRATEPRP